MKGGILKTKLENTNPVHLNLENDLIQSRLQVLADPAPIKSHTFLKWKFPKKLQVLDQMHFKNGSANNWEFGPIVPS